MRRGVFQRLTGVLLSAVISAGMTPAGAAFADNTGKTISDDAGPQDVAMAYDAASADGEENDFALGDYNYWIMSSDPDGYFRALHPSGDLIGISMLIPKDVTATAPMSISTSWGEGVDFRADGYGFDGDRTHTSFDYSTWEGNDYPLPDEDVYTFQDDDDYEFWYAADDGIEFDIYLPDDPSIAGDQTVTVSVDGSSVEIPLFLGYIGNYEETDGWCLIDQKEWKSYDVSFEDMKAYITGIMPDDDSPTGVNDKGEMIDRLLVIDFSIPKEVASDATVSMSTSWGAAFDLRKDVHGYYLDNGDYSKTNADYDYEYASVYNGFVDKAFLYVYLPDDPSIAGKQTIDLEVGGTETTVTVDLSYEGDYATGKGWTLNGAEFAEVAEKTTEAMYRLYNPNTGEHFYTSDPEERANVIAAGWNDEGIGWYAPVTDKRPVYRLYNAVGGEHHYTLDAGERDMLVANGWRDEGIGWHSGDGRGIPVYREYNPNKFSCNHNFTADKDEHDHLVSLGWVDEGIAWYAGGVEWKSFDVTIDDYIVGLEKIDPEVGPPVCVDIEEGQILSIYLYSLPNDIMKRATLSMSTSWGESIDFRNEKYGFDGDASHTSFAYCWWEGDRNYNTCEGAAFAVCLPDDPSLAGDQTITLEIGGTVKEIPIKLGYIGDYKTTNGWHLLEVRDWKSFDISIDDVDVTVGDSEIGIEFDVPYEVASEATASISTSWGADFDLRWDVYGYEYMDEDRTTTNVDFYECFDEDGTDEYVHYEIYLPNDPSIAGDRTITVELGGVYKEIPVKLVYTDCGWCVREKKEWKSYDVSFDDMEMHSSGRNRFTAALSVPRDVAVNASASIATSWGDHFDLREDVYGSYLDIWWDDSTYLKTNVWFDWYSSDQEDETDAIVYYSIDLPDDPSIAGEQTVTLELGGSTVEIPLNLVYYEGGFLGNGGWDIEWE